MSRRTRLAPTTSGPHRAAVDRVRPDPLLWSTVRRLVGDDLSRVEVLSPTHAVIHNHGRKTHR